MAKINQKEILHALKADLAAAKILRENLDGKIQTWKKEYNAEPYGNERKDRSSIISRDIKKQSEWQHAALIEPFVSTPDIIKANPVTFEDSAIAPKIEVLLNTQFCRQFNRFNFMTKALKILDQEGTVIVRTGWEFEEKTIEVLEDVEVLNPEFLQAQAMAQQGMLDLNMLAQIPQVITQQQKKLKKTPIKNHPTAMVVRNEDIFIDPTCQDDMDKCQFVIYRYESDMTTLKQSEIYKNLDKVALTQRDGEYKNPDETEFRFQDNPRKKLIVYEYWGNYDVNGDGIAEPIICTWIDDIIVRLQDNPFPDKKPPFLIVPFSSVPFTLYGESNAELLSDIQKIKTAIYRGFIDNMALSNNGQKGIRKGALDYTNKKRFLEGNNFEFNGTPHDFWDGHFNELPGSAFNVLQLMNNEAESVTGIKSFGQGINANSLGATATGVRGTLDSASSRRLNIVRNISENLIKPLLRKWLAYNSEFLDEQSQFRITNDEFIYLKKDDLGANIDIELTISTSDDNQAKASELAFLLQTLGPSEDPGLRKMIMAKIARLYKMADLANGIENYEPEPDPIAQEMAQLQLELLRSQVELEKSKVGKNVVDADLKEAKTQTELAKASNISSRTDSQDLDYLQKYHGVNERKEAERQQVQNDFNLTKDILKMLGNTKKQNL